MTADPVTVAETVLEAVRSGRQVAPFTASDPAFDLAAAYRAARRVHGVRLAEGWRARGRKIGFTNRTIWNDYNVAAPVWAHMYDRTIGSGETATLAGLLEPRIEPEIVFRLSAAPCAGSSDEELMSCIGAVAHGFELVQSLYPGWRFAAPDTVAGFGMHGRLVTGPFTDIAAPDRAEWMARLADFHIRLFRDGTLVDEGHSANVLGGGPLAALAHLVEVLADDPDSAPLTAGEIVTTGTLTGAPEASAGETWTTELRGLTLPGLTLRLT